jgi:hypothetical protein
MLMPQRRRIDGSDDIGSGAWGEPNGRDGGKEEEEPDELRRGDQND